MRRPMKSPTSSRWPPHRRPLILTCLQPCPCLLSLEARLASYRDRQWRAVPVVSHAQTRTRFPRGVATLETVMSMPILLALLAIMLVIGSASTKKVSAVTEARYRAWAERSNAAQEPLSASTIQTGEIERSGFEEVSLPKGLASLTGGDSATAESRNSLVVGKWEDPQAEMSRSTGLFIPHLKPMSRMMSSGPSFGLAGLSSQLDPGQVDAFLGNMGGNFADVGGGLAEIGSSQSETFGKSSMTREVMGRLTSSITQQATATLSSQVGNSGLSGGAARQVAQVMNQAVGVAGEALAFVAKLFNPQEMINEILDFLPPGVKEIAKEVLDSSSTLIGGALELGSDLLGLGGDLGDALGGAVDAITSPFGGGDDEESEEEKENKKNGTGIGKALSRGLKFLKGMSNLRDAMTAPMINLRDASRGRPPSMPPADNAKVKELENMLQFIEPMMEVFSALDQFI